MSVSSQAFQTQAQQANQQKRLQPQPITPNRYTRTRTRPVNPSRPVRQPAPIQPGGPSMRPTNPAITNPNVRIGVPMQPPITKRPVTGGPDPIPSFVTPPASDSLNAQVITPITNPATGETYMAPNAGYTLNPNITNPNASIGFGPAPIQQPQPGGPYTPRPDLGPNVGFGVGLPQPQLEAQPYTSGTIGGKSFGGPSMGFGAQVPPGQEMNPEFQNYAGYQGGFNPSLGNTTLPGNF